MPLPLPFQMFFFFKWMKRMNNVSRLLRWCYFCLWSISRFSIFLFSRSYMSLFIYFFKISILVCTVVVHISLESLFVRLFLYPMVLFLFFMFLSPFYLVSQVFFHLKVAYSQWQVWMIELLSFSLIFPAEHDKRRSTLFCENCGGGRWLLSAHTTFLELDRNPFSEYIE
jgi:hypothetical protein